MVHVVGTLGEAFEQESRKQAAEALGLLVQGDQYVGEVFSIGYETADLQIHDYHRQRVGGIPSLCFLLATRVQPDARELDPAAEDTSVILLRVLDSAPLPHSSEAERVRVETAQRVSGEIDRHWDDPSVMDAATAQVLSYAGVRCRVLGTFYVDDVGGRVSLRFGSDLSNYYPNRGLKVYKPTGDALEIIVNYRTDDAEANSPVSVSVGAVRYASTVRPFQGISDVPVSISPADLIGQRTALFGMTRTGKSNTVKIVVQSTTELFDQSSEEPRAGQIIFDVNGEYANANQQDDGTAIFELYPSRVTRYSVLDKPNFKVMKLNFYRSLDAGFSVLSTLLADDDADYVKAFTSIDWEQPDQSDFSAATRYDRRVAAYKACLYRAGFAQQNETVRFSSSKEIRESSIPGLAGIEPKDGISLDDAAAWFTAAWDHYKDSPGPFEAYKSENGGREWADEDLQTLMRFLTRKSQPGSASTRESGYRKLIRGRDLHTSTTGRSFDDEIVDLLRDGQIVIIDLSQGNPDIQRTYSDRVCKRLFADALDRFIKNDATNFIQLYFEEAHNLFPRRNDTDLLDIYNRLAKEGAKLRLGVVYSTQEVSSISSNILKNTQNWFIGHLNNSDETRELIKYYDFADFERSIRRAQDRGFLRVKTLSNPFVIPVQVRRFSAAN